LLLDRPAPTRTDQCLAALSATDERPGRLRELGQLCGAAGLLDAGELGGDALGLLQKRVEVFCLDEFVGLQMLKGPGAAHRQAGRGRRPGRGCCPRRRGPTGPSTTFRQPTGRRSPRHVRPITTAGTSRAHPKRCKGLPGGRRHEPPKTHSGDKALISISRTTAHRPRPHQ